MKFGRKFSSVSCLVNKDLNVGAVVCFLNRAMDEIVNAEEYLVRKSGLDDVESRAVYSVRDEKSGRGFYVLVNSDAFVVGMSVNNEKRKKFRMNDEVVACETKLKTVKSDPPRFASEMFRTSASGTIGKGIIDAFGLHSPGCYKLTGDHEVPGYLMLKDGQVILSQ